MPCKLLSNCRSASSTFKIGVELYCTKDFQSVGETLYRRTGSPSNPRNEPWQSSSGSGI